MLRLRMKVWTDKFSGKRFLAPIALARTSAPSKMSVYVMTDDDTRFIEIGEEEWNKLPFYYFKEDGEVQLTERPTRAADSF